MQHPPLTVVHEMPRRRRRRGLSLVSALALTLGGGLTACQPPVADDPETGAPGGHSGRGGGSGAGMGGMGGGAMPGVDRPGPSPLRRLTQNQYDNTVRDLLGLTRDPNITFVADEGEVNSFVANAIVPVQSLQLSQYQDSAEDLSTRAVAMSLSKLAPCTTPATDDSCGDNFVRNFGKRAYRRPLTNEELALYHKLFVTERTARGYGSAIGLTIQAFLQSPNFIYRFEVGTGKAESDGAIPITQFEIASRLSYFLWNSMPDDALLTAAEKNQLDTPDTIAAMAAKMIKDGKARDAIIAFASQWLEMSSLDTLEKETTAFNTDLRTAMRDEVMAFVDNVIRQEDGRLETLLTASFSYLRGPLYPLYGLTAPPGTAANNLTKVDLTAGNRAGILMLPAVLATHAHPDQSAPVRRGFLIRGRMLCQPPPPPPPTVDNSPPEVNADATTRERFRMHSEKPECASCHKVMDPLGMPFEIFDEIGRYRSTENKKTIDSSGELTGTSNDGTVANPVELAKRLAGSDEAKSCLAQQWFRFLSGRKETDDDTGAIERAANAFKDKNDRIPDLMVALTTTRNFRYRKGQ